MLRGLDLIVRVLFGVFGLVKGEVESRHILVPRHELLSKEDSERVLRELGVKSWQLPRIAQDDPCIQEFQPEIGQLVKVSRKSELVGEYTVYRYVTSPVGLKTASALRQAAAAEKEQKSKKTKKEAGKSASKATGRVPKSSDKIKRKARSAPKPKKVVRAANRK